MFEGLRPPLLRAYFAKPVEVGVVDVLASMDGSMAWSRLNLSVDSAEIDKGRTDGLIGSAEYAG